MESKIASKKGVERYYNWASSDWAKRRDPFTHQTKDRMIAAMLVTIRYTHEESERYKFISILTFAASSEKSNSAMCNRMITTLSKVNDLFHREDSMTMNVAMDCTICFDSILLIPLFFSVRESLNRTSFVTP